MVASINCSGGKAIVVQADLSIGPPVASVAAEFGPIDILVNNVGVYEFRPLE